MPHTSEELPTILVTVPNCDLYCSDFTALLLLINPISPPMQSPRHVTNKKLETYSFAIRLAECEPLALSTHYHSEEGNNCYTMHKLQL